MDSFDAEFIQERGDISGGELRFLTIDRSRPTMWCMLRFGGGRMAQSEKSLGNIVGHGDVNKTSIIVPVNFKSEITGPGPVFGERIASGECSEKVIGISLGEKFNTKIVDGKSERGATVGVTPKAGSVRDGEVTERSEMRFELIISEDGGFLETIHAFADFDVEITFGVEEIVGQVVFGDDLGCDVTAMNAHVLIDEHIGDKEEVFQVAGAVTGAEMSIGDDAIDVKLGVGETNSRRSDVLIGIEAIATDGHADSENLGLARSHGADEVGVCDLAARRDLVRFDENHCVVAADLFADGARLCETLSAAPPLIR